MNWFRQNRVAVVAAFFFTFFAFAQNDVLVNGMDSSGNVQRLLLESSGRLTSPTHGACINTTMNVGTTGTACPATASSGRSSLLIQLVQSGETLTITTDGATVATATAGVEIESGGIYTDNLSGTVAASCRCSAATCSVRIVECP